MWFLYLHHNASINKREISDKWVAKFCVQNLEAGQILERLVKEQDYLFGRLNSVSVFKHTAASESRVLTSQNRLQGAPGLPLIWFFHLKKKEKKNREPSAFPLFEDNQQMPFAPRQRRTRKKVEKIWPYLWWPYWNTNLDTLVPCPRFPNVCPLPTFLRREGKAQIPESITAFNALCQMQQRWSRAAAAVSVDSIDGARKLNACWVALCPDSSDLTWYKKKIKKNKIYTYSLS